MFSFFRKFLRSAPTPVSDRQRLEFAPERFSAIYAIGDIHGHINLLAGAEAAIRADAERFPGEKLVVYLGDFIDRGPHSSKVLQHFCEPVRLDNFTRVCICGNHDDAMLKFLENPSANIDWLRFGGDTTIGSYGIDANYTMEADRTGEQLRDALIGHVPKAHRELLESLPVMVQVGTYVFVHAGIEPGVPLDEQEDGDLMWIREPFLDEGPRLKNTIVVHGHTPSTGIDWGKNRIGIDTGAYMTGKLGVLRIVSNTPEELIWQE